jgi:hypothetical protein
LTIVNDTLRRPDQEPELHHPRGLTPYKALVERPHDALDAETIREAELCRHA